MALRFRQRTRSLAVLSALGVLSAAGGVLTAAGSAAAPGPDKTATHRASATVAMTCPLDGPVSLTMRTTVTLPASVKTGQTLSLDDFTATFTLPHDVAQALTTTGSLAGGLTFGLAVHRDDKKDTIPVPMTFAPTAVGATGDVTLTATGRAPGLALDTPGAVTLDVTAPTLALSPALAGTGTGPGTGSGTGTPGTPGAPGTPGTPSSDPPSAPENVLPDNGSSSTGSSMGTGSAANGSTGTGSADSPSAATNAASSTRIMATGPAPSTGGGSSTGSSGGSSTGSSTSPGPGSGSGSGSGSDTNPSTPTTGEPPQTGTTPPTGGSPTGTPPAKEVACTLSPGQPTSLGTLMVLPGQAAAGRVSAPDDEPLSIITPLVLVRIVARSTVVRLGANITSTPTALLNGIWTIRLDPATGIPIDSTVSGTTSFKPQQSTFLGFGFVPVTATVEFLPVDYRNAKQIPINGAITTDANGVSILTSHIDVMARLSNAKVNGQPLDVGPDCVTSEPVGLDLRGPYEPLGVGSIGTDPNSPDPKFRGFVLPPFRSCGATEPLSPLLTGMASGPGNQAHVETLNLAECTSPDHNQCPPDPNLPPAQAVNSPR